MAIAKEAVEKGPIDCDWCPEEYFKSTSVPAYTVPDNPDNLILRGFVHRAVRDYGQTFDQLYPDLETNPHSQKAFNTALENQEPGGRLVFQALGDRQSSRARSKLRRLK
jgi:hypothetical protein